MLYASTWSSIKEAGLCQCWFLLSLMFHNSIVLCMLLLWCKCSTSFLACIFWGLYHQKNCCPLAGCRGVTWASSVQCCHMWHEENTCTFFWAFSLPTGISEFLPCMFPGHHWLDFVFLHSWPHWMKDWELLWGLMGGRGGFLNVRNSAMYLRFSEDFLRTKMWPRNCLPWLKWVNHEA